MKRMRAILCGVLAALMLAGCGTQTDVRQPQGGGVAAVDLRPYAVK